MQVGADVRVGDLRRRRFTLPQAAHVLGLRVDAVRKMVDRGWLTPAYLESGGRRIRMLDGIDIVCLMVGHAVSAKVRNQVYAELKRRPDDGPLGGSLALEVGGSSGRRTIDVPLERSVGEVLAGMDALERTTQTVDAADGTIRGTGVEAHRIAALIDGGMQPEDVLRDYPNLTRPQLEAAVAYARANPKQGRPYPTRTVKSALRRGRGGLERAFAVARDGA
jgi:uncharacterized protein (DUF433 family)